ncbi:MAG: hypothetical protein JSV27_08390 [Candidatus Bathyarchaeota archaeon]|nr:MAG: hypothetical protein JSV27_08390 [Candidatus Bathyarchaeota archaeon]
MAGRKLEESMDACPLAPSTDPPSKGVFDTLLNFYDGFFGNWKLVTLSLLLASVALGYSMMTVPAPMVVLPGLPESWSIPFAQSFSHHDSWGSRRTPSYTEVTVQEGDLVLEEGDVLVIENMTLVLNGEMLVRDGAKLILQEGELFLNQSLDYKRSFKSLEPVYYHHAVRFEGSSTLQATDSEIVSLDGECSIGFFGDSRGEVSGSDLRRINLCVSDRASFAASHSSINWVVVDSAASVDLGDCQISRVGLPHDLSRGSWEDCSIVVARSRIRDLELEFKDDALAVVSTPIQGYHAFWNPYSNVTVRGMAVNVTLRETRVQGQVQLTMLDGDIQFKGLSGSYEVHSLKGSLSVSDSVVDVVVAAESAFINNTVCSTLQFSDLVQGTVVDSKVGSVKYLRFKGYVAYDNVIIKDALVDSYCNGRIEGTISYAKSPYRFSTWGEGGLTRVFRVLAHADGRALKDVKLKVYDKGGSLLWSGETDTQGAAGFSVRSVLYTSPVDQATLEQRYSEPLVLEAESAGVSQKAMVSFGVDTPIVFAFDAGNAAAYAVGREHLAVLSGSVIVLIVIGFSLYCLQYITRSRSRPRPYFGNWGA